MSVSTDPAPLPALARLMTFDEASERVLDHLSRVIPFGFWSVSAYDGATDRQVYLHLRDRTYGNEQGGSVAWTDSFCQHMVLGAAPQIAPDAMAVPQYAGTDVARRLAVGAYIGVPIRRGDGKLFGTLCGLDPAVQPADLAEHAGLLELLAALLGQILTAEQLRDEAAEREATLRWRAFHDELTGLPNRALLNDRLAHALARAERPHRSLALLTVDVDDFKAVNDTFGHPGGDQLLVQLAERLQRAVRAGDTVARVGGDEFVILLDGDTDDLHQLTPALARRVLAATSDPFLVVGREIAVRVSVGAADLAGAVRGTSPDTLLAHADLALYSAKRAGKGRVALYEPTMQLPEARDLELREPFRRALAEGGVHAVYQPIIRLDTQEVSSLECLARWDHQGEAVPPAVFIPLAARADLLPRLTEVMLDHACRQLRCWSTLGHDDLGVAVNVPPGLLGDPTFPARAAAQVERHGLHPDRLTLEITEDALLGDLDTARRVCEDLRARGFVLSLDDFGTGYSSLLHLRSIPLTSVKIDRGFTRDVDTDPRTRRFLRAVLTMGRDLGLRVVVEGVERQSQAEVLRELGATHAQGYLYARPAPAEDVQLSRR